MDVIELKPRNENIFIKPRKKKYYLEATKNVESREHLFKLKRYCVGMSL